jgi:hypothetical protein
MSFKALAFNILAHHLEIINNIALSIFKEKINVIDIKTSEVELNNTDVVLAFGKKAHRLAKNKCLALQLPELSKLEDRKGNEEIRVATYTSLLEFKKQIDLLQTIIESDLNLTCNELLSLENSLKNKKEVIWKGNTKAGKSIELSLVPQKEKNADISLTFAEMYAIRTAMDTLNVEKIIVS